MTDTITTNGEPREALLNTHNWEYVTIQGGRRYYRTLFKVGTWDVFAKQLQGGWRAYEACHRAVRLPNGMTIDGKTARELAEKLAVIAEAR